MTLSPDFIAYEPPELIGGDVSVTSAEPSVISDVVKLCSSENIRVLVGAGVKNDQDARMSIELGADGVLIASGIVKAMEPIKALNVIIQGIIDSL
jgi:triosephosphate isomerase